MQSKPNKLQLDLNNPVFQKRLFNLTKNQQRGVLNTLRKLSSMQWEQIYSDSGLNWELILSKVGPNNQRLYSIRISKGFRAVVYRKDNWMRFLTLHPDHDSAY